MTREERKINNFNLYHKIIDGIIYRQCTKCKQWFIENKDNFYMLNKSKLEKGFVARCKRCSADDVLEFKRANPELVHQRNLATDRKYKVEKNQKNKDWQKRNREYYKSYIKQYWKSNPDKIKMYQENRGHKNHIINKREWTACKNYFCNSCAYCGLPADQHYRKYKGVNTLNDLHKEHVDHEGSRYLDNCVPACVSCNSTKWKHPMEEWYKQQEFFSEERLQKIYKWINEDYKLYIETMPEERKII